GGLEVQVERRLRVAGGRLGLRQRFQSSRLQPEVLADHVVAAHASRQTTSTLALEMEDFPGLLDQIVQHPLLTIPRERRSAANRRLGACHASDPPLRRHGLSAPRSLGLARVAAEDSRFKRFLQSVSNRLRHGSRSTEKSYVGRIRRYILFHGKR